MKPLFIYILMLLALLSCSDEDRLEPSPDFEALYSLPQGTHDYDQKILDYYNRFGCYFLYVYTVEQACWSVDRKLEDTEITLPDENRIKQLLELIDNKFLKYYPDTLLRRTMPLRLFLTGSTLEKLYWTEDGILPGYNSLLIPGAREMEYSPSFIMNFKNTFHQGFIENYLVKKVQIPKEFKQVSRDYYGLPFNRGYGFFSNTGSKNVEADWKEFLVQAAINTQEYLKMRYFNAMFDPNGLLEKKYNVVIKYMIENYNVDIAAIGNDIEQ